MIYKHLLNQHLQGINSTEASMQTYRVFITTHKV